MSYNPGVSNEEKRAVWEAYRAGTPIRVPVMLATNPRIILLDPALNPGAMHGAGITFEEYFDDAETMLQVGLQHAYHRATVLHRFTDDPVGLPERWTIHVDRQNVYEAAYLGSPVVHRAGQVPDAIPWLTDANKRAVFERDISDPLRQDFFQDSLDLCHRMQALAAERTFHGRPITVANYAPTGNDGPLTVAVSLRGQGMLLDLAADPAYADELMAFITQAAINRVRAVRAYWGDPDLAVGLADDAVQLVSTPRQVYDRTCEILRSGIKDGGRFILREGNNLPPRTPADNLAAMYAACLDEGRYP